jgi:hypothetical protein
MRTYLAVFTLAALAGSAYADAPACPQNDGFDGATTAKVTAAIKAKLNKPIQLQQWTCTAGSFPTPGWFITAVVQPSNATARADGKAYRAIIDADFKVIKGDASLGENIPEAMYVTVATQIQHATAGDVVVEDWTGTNQKVDPPVDYYKSHVETVTAAAKLVTKLKVSLKP